MRQLASIFDFEVKLQDGSTRIGMVRVAREGESRTRVDFRSLGPWEAADDGKPFSTFGAALDYARQFAAECVAQRTFGIDTRTLRRETEQ